MKKYLLFIILTLIPLTLCAWGVGMSGVSLLSGSEEGGEGAYSYIGFPQNGTTDTVHVPDDSTNVTAEYCWVRYQAAAVGQSGTAHRIKVYFGTNRTGTFEVTFYKNGNLVATGTITPAAGWVWSDALTPYGAYTESDLAFTASDNLHFGIHVYGGTISHDITRDDTAGSYYYVNGTLPATFTGNYDDYSWAKDLAVLLEY